MVTWKDLKEDIDKLTEAQLNTEIWFHSADSDSFNSIALEVAEESCYWDHELSRYVTEGSDDERFENIYDKGDVYLTSYA